MEAQPCRTDGSISPRLFITNASDGNLSVQLKKLEGWEYIKSEKKLINGKGVTQYQITETEIKQFEEYVVFLESVIADKDNDIQ